MASNAGGEAIDGAAEEFLSGKLSHVDVGRIERELKSLWDKASADGGNTVMRACSFNIVLISADDNAETIGGDLLDDLLLRRPGRGILLAYRPTKPHSLDAWVSARCHLEGKNKQICAESITVCCEGGHPEEMASVVLPLLIRELPVFLYWRSDLNGKEVFNALAGASNRLIVDTMRSPFDLSQCKRIEEIVRNKRSALVTSDLSWRRLSGWLRALADAFDGFPMPTDYLKKISQITIAVELDPDRPEPSGNVVSMQAILLAGWLANRLGWRLMKKLKDNTIEYVDSLENPVVLKFVANPRTQPLPCEHGCLEKVECVFDDQQRLLVSTEEFDELTYMVAHLTDSGCRESTRAHYNLDESALLGQEIDNLATDPVYEGAVQAAARTLV